jgi:hypothetical protein
VKPIIKEVEKEIQYDSITKYSYLDEKKFVKYFSWELGSTCLFRGSDPYLPKASLLGSWTEASRLRFMAIMAKTGSSLSPRPSAACW